MAHLLPIYEAFEGPFRRLVFPGEGDDEGSGVGEEGEAEAEEAAEEVVKGLRGMYARGLERGARLTGDVETVLRLRLRGRAVDPGRRPRLEAFTERIRTAVSGRPHLLLAYTWVLYLALFSGGRYIRAGLRGAGAGFWHRGVREGGSDGGSLGKGLEGEEGGGGVDGCLGFWTFEGEADGEDLKAGFKAGFAAVEGTLTEAEKEEVVREAVFIMQSMTGVVVEISEVVGTGNPVAAGQWVDQRLDGRKDEDEPSMRWLLLKHVLPMGMVELIAAGARSALSVGMVPSFWSARAE